MKSGFREAPSTISIKNKIIIAIICLQAVAVSCYYDNEELLYGAEVCSTGPATYTEVASIISNNCLQCHSTGGQMGGIILEGYDNLKQHASSGRLYGAISHASGFSPMPKNAPQLSACNITRIKQWIDEGAINN